MQRIDVILNEDEYVCLKAQFKGEYSLCTINRTIVIVNYEGFKMEYKLHLKGESNKKVSLNIIGRHGVCEHLIFNRISDLIGVFKINIKEKIGEEVLLRLKKECNPGTYHKTWYDCKMSEINTIKYFISTNTEDKMLNYIKYLDFSKEEELILCLYGYICRTETKSGYESTLDKLINKKLCFWGFKESCLPEKFKSEADIEFHRLLIIYYYAFNNRLTDLSKENLSSGAYEIIQNYYSKVAKI